MPVAPCLLGSRTPLCKGLVIFRTGDSNAAGSQKSGPGTFDPGWMHMSQFERACGELRLCHLQIQTGYDDVMKTGIVAEGKTKRRFKVLAIASPQWYRYNPRNSQPHIEPWKLIAPLS